MPETPANDDLVAAQDATEASPAVEVSRTPRTIKRRAQRRVHRASAPTVSTESAEPADSEPDEFVEPESTDTPNTATENEPVIETPPAAEAETEAEAEADIEADAEAVVETVAEAEADAVTEADAGSARTGRIEVPVPSVVRARERAAIATQNPVVLRAESLTKSYGQLLAAADISFEVHAGSLTGVVGPNGAGKTTVLSMISGLNRPTSGRISVGDIDVWSDGPAAKRVIGSLPDRLRLFDRLTGGQLLYYAGVLQGLDRTTVAQRAAELATAFGLESALGRPVSDYSAGMQKKIGLACSMIHSPDVLVLDEPYETIDPVSASNVTEILEKYVAGGGSVIMSSHSLDLIQRICDHAVIIVDGSIVAQGTVDEVRDGVSLEERFTHLTRGEDEGKGLEWLHGSSDSD